jgi:hypothetical protein
MACLCKELLEALSLGLWTPYGPEDFSNTCPNLKHTPAGLSHITSYSKMMTTQDKIRQQSSAKKSNYGKSFLAQTAR